MATADEEDIDLETAQAQIDRSLAFAEELASSWLKPSHASAPAKRTTEQEFAELIRRPPRLGVGAAAPETSAGLNTRDTARLKSRLTGNKKRSREEDRAPAAPTSVLPVVHDDEDESRAGAIRKKQKVDPFALSTKKAKSKKPRAHAAHGVNGLDPPPTAADHAPAASSAASSASVRHASAADPSAAASSSNAKHAAAPPPRVVAPPLDQGRAEAGAGATHVGDGDKGRVLFLDGPPPALEGGAGPEDGAGALKRRKRRKKKKKGTELVVAGVEDADNESE